MTNNTPLTRRQAFRQAAYEGVIGAEVLRARLAWWLQSVRVRIGLAAAATVLGVAVNVMPALAASGVTGGTGCHSTSATALLGYVNLLAQALIIIGGSVFVLMFSLGALFIMFGVSQTRADKGMEIVKQSLVGLAILIGGILIKEVVVGLVFKKPPGTPGGGSSVC